MNIALSWADYLIIVLYFVAMLAIGWYFAKNKSDAADFLLGGRKMPWFPVAVSMLMSVFSTYSLVMGPGEIYNHGLDWGIISLFTPFIGVLSVLLFTKFFFKIQAFTPFEYLAYRYDPYVRLLAALGHCYSSVLYGGMVLLTTAKIFEAAAGWPCWATILAVGGISVIYTGTGGLRAVVWTDFVQFFVMLAGMGGLIVTLCWLTPGGAVGAVTYAFEHGHGLSRFNEADFYTLWPYVRLTFWALLIERVFGALSTGVSQMTVQRLMATGSVRNAVKAQFSSALITLPLCLLLDFIGLAIYSYYAQFPDPRVTAGDLALFTFVATKLPPLLPGLFIAAALAAAMSTLSSIFNGDASVWLKEVYLPYLRRDADDRRQVNFSKFATIAVGALVIGFALMQDFSARWLDQTMVEVGMIFGIFTVTVGIFNYGFAIFSRKASSLSFWSMIAFGYGFKVAMLLWYTFSKRGEVTFKASGDLGLAGPLGLEWVLCPAAAALLLVLIGLWRIRVRMWRLSWFVAAQIPGAFAMGCALWYYFSHTGDPTQPQVLSFTWVGIPGLFATLLYMAGWHLFGPEVAPERYQGLVWGYSNGEVHQLEN